MGWGSLLAAIWAVALCQSNAVAQLSASSDPTDQKSGEYFLSVMVLERNQSSFLQEFVRHYLEEGVDHFFIYNAHNTPHIHHELDCMDQKYYTIMPHLPEAESSSKVRQTVYDSIKSKTKWLIQVDSDDYISSRAAPETTIREILERKVHGMCSIITVPTINYAWGDTAATPLGKVRTSLTHRWGYRHKHDYNTTAGKGRKFSDSYARAKNKVVFLTSAVVSVRTNSAAYAERNNICVASVNDTQHCVHLAKTAQSSAAQGGTGTAQTAPAGPSSELVLPKYCPQQSLYRARRSSSALYLLEEDIPGLSLACHHYRIPSWQEWERRAKLHPHLYKQTDVALANRLDINDDYMLRRAQVRRDHPQQQAAERAMQRCQQPGRSSSSSQDHSHSHSRGSRKERQDAETRADPWRQVHSGHVGGNGEGGTVPAAGSGGRGDAAGVPGVGAVRTADDDNSQGALFPLVDKLLGVLRYIARVFG